jgi:hypothetical protein
MIALSPVNYGGRLFMPGESVEGHIPMEMIEQLQANGMVGEGEPTDLDDAKQTAEPDDNKQLDPTLILTVEDFRKLGAQEQKEQLEALNIEPASKTEGRIQQYTDCLVEVGNANV